MDRCGAASTVEAALSLLSTRAGHNALALLSTLTGGLAFFTSTDAVEKLPHVQDVLVGLAGLPAFD
eukprot:40071-Eustigmatos_ZCMA.PRE.1